MPNEDYAKQIEEMGYTISRMHSNARVIVTGEEGIMADIKEDYVKMIYGLWITDEGIQGCRQVTKALELRSKIKTAGIPIRDEPSLNEMRGKSKQAEAEVSNLIKALQSLEE